MLARKIIVTCDVLVELPDGVEDTDSFASIEARSAEEAIRRITSLIEAGQGQGVSLAAKFGVQNARVKVMFLNRGCP